MASGPRYFWRLPSHKLAATSLYRALLRACKRNLENREVVTSKFKQHRNITSVWRARDEFNEGYKALEALQANKKHIPGPEKRYGPQTVYVKSIKVAPNVRCSPVVQLDPEAIKLKSLQSRVSFILACWQARKIDTSVPKGEAMKVFVETIKAALEYNGYRAPKPTEIDLKLPIYNRVLAAMEYRDAVRRLRRWRYVFRHRGPTQIKVIYKPFRYALLEFRFIRGPWKQPKAVNAIYQAVRKLHDRILVLQQSEAGLWEKMEADWELRMATMLAEKSGITIDKRKLEKQIIGQWKFPLYLAIALLQRRTNYFRRKLERFRTHLDETVQKQQRKANQIHIERKMKWDSVEKQLKDTKYGAFTSPTLNEFLRQNGF